jgi:hypothetical protein
MAEDSREEILGCYREMISINSMQKRTDNETTKLSTSLERKQEQVRIALYKKKLAVCNVDDTGSSSNSSSSTIDEEEGEAEEDNVKVATKELVQIQQKENVLKTEFTRLQDRVSNLKQGARKLRARSELIRRQSKAPREDWERQYKDEEEQER